MNPYIQLGVFLSLALLYSIFYGMVIRKFPTSTLATNIACKILPHTTMTLDQIKFYLIWFGYLFTGMGGMFIFTMLYGVNLMKYIPASDIFDTALYTLIGFVTQFEISSFLLVLISAAKTEINWYRVVGEIEWVKISNKLNRRQRFFYVISSALFEELLFRCSFFLILVTQFPFVHPFVAIGLTTFLFIIEQVICVQNRIQAVAMTTGSIAISIIGCLLIVTTGSILPAILCHEMYVIFYLF